MTYKNNIEPKGARVFNTYNHIDDFDEIDDWAWETATSKPRRRKTGTQALVDFLNTTGPDEYQKATPTKKTTYKLITTIPTKRFTSPAFFLRRRNKSKTSKSSTPLTSTPSSSTTSEVSSLASLYPRNTPNTIQRKNYIEIVTPGQSTKRLGQEDTSVSASKLSLNELLFCGNPSSLHNVSIQSKSAKPSHPNLHTSTFDIPSIDTNSTFDATAPVTYLIKSPSSQKTFNPNKSIKIAMKESEHEKRTSTTSEGMDVIEAGLIQRLKQCQLSSGTNQSSDGYANDSNQPSVKPLAPIHSTKDHFKTTRIRHTQVQTLPYDLSSSAQQENDSYTSHSPVTTPTNSYITRMTLLTHTTAMDLIQQLEQERRKRQQVERALKETCDHFEVLSELANRKIQELGEEKLRWENACVDLNDDLIRIKGDGNVGDLTVVGALTEITNKTSIP